jgi:hypothetical protein
MHILPGSNASSFSSGSDRLVLLTNLNPTYGQNKLKLAAKQHAFLQLLMATLLVPLLPFVLKCRS